MTRQNLSPGPPLAPAYKNQQVRDGLVDIALKADEAKVAVAIGARSDCPLYQLRGASIVRKGELAASIQIGAD